MLNKPTYGSQPIKNEQDRTVKPYLFDDIAQNNKQDQEKYVSLVDLQEFIFNTCNVEDNTIFIDFHNYLQFLARQRSFNHHPLSPEDIKRAASKYAFENNTHRSNSKAFIAGANFAKQPHSNESNYPIEFIMRYSGQPSDKINKAYQRYLNELPHTPKK